jgi:hypothetical protein
MTVDMPRRGVKKRKLPSRRLAQTPPFGVCDVPKGHARLGGSIQPVYTRD